MTSHPHNPLHTLRIPHPCSPSLPPRCSTGFGLLRLPAGTVQSVEGCIPWLIVRHLFPPLCHWFRLQSPAVSDMLTLPEISPSLPDPLWVEDAEESVLAKRDLSSTGCNEGQPLQRRKPSWSRSLHFVHLWPTWLCQQECRRICKCILKIQFEESETLTLITCFSACARFGFTWHW